MSELLINIALSAAFFFLIVYLFRRMANATAGFKGTGEAAASSGPSRVTHIRSLAQFKGEINKSRLTVVDFTATWCGPCQRIAPVYSRLSSQFAKAGFLKVDVDECYDIAQEYDVMSMPTFHFWRSGKQVGSFSGADAQKLTREITRLIRD